MLYIFSAYLASIYKYVYADITSEAVLLDDVLAYPYHSKIKQFARRFFIGRIPLPKRLLLSLLKCGEREKRYLKNIRPYDKVLIFDVYNPRIFKVFRNLFLRRCDVYIYFSNPVERIWHTPRKNLEKFREMEVVCCSFDPYDAQKYGIRMAGQYWLAGWNVNTCVCHKNNCHAFFCGQEKDRSEEIVQIRTFLQNNHVQCDFCVPIHPEERLSFEDYLSRLSCADILVDINQKGQSGLTRRPIEALLWNKKLVTNNKDIVNYDFYRPENIFIYGVDDPCGFEHFVESPLTEVSGNIKYRYTVGGWLEQFL